jgi:hypothetical protein
MVPTNLLANFDTNLHYFQKFRNFQKIKNIKKNLYFLKENNESFQKILFKKNENFTIN